MVSFYILQVLLAILSLLALALRSHGFPVFIFWPIVLLFFVYSYFLFRSIKSSGRLFILCIISITLVLIKVFSLFPLYTLGTDEIFEAQFAQTIVSQGIWDPSQGSGFAANYYGYTPILHFMLSAITLLSGIDPYTLIKYFFPILYKVIFMILTLLLVEEVTGNKKHAYLSTFIFLGCAGYAFIGVTRRSTAGIFLMLSLYCILKGFKARWFFLYLLFSILLVLSNRTIAMYFLAFLMLAFVYGKITQKPLSKKFNSIMPYLIYFILAFSASQLIYSDIYLAEDSEYLEEIRKILTGSFDASNYVSIYHPFEKLLIIGAQSIFLLLACSGLWLFLRRKASEVEGMHDNFLIFFALLGIIFYSFSSLLMQSHLDTAVTIMLWFFSIPLCIMIGYSAQVCQNKSVRFIAILFLIILFSSSLLMGVYTPRLTNRLPGEDIVLGQDDRSKSEALYDSGSWLLHNAKGNKVLGDFNVYHIYSGFFGFDVNSDSDYLTSIYFGGANEIQTLIRTGRIEFGSYHNIRYQTSVNYITTNKALERLKSNLFGEPVAPSSEMNNVIILNKIYSNSDIAIYEVSMKDV